MALVRVVPHLHVSEREGPHEWPDGRPDDAAWEDCLWASAVEWVRAQGRDVPATHAEAEALRADSGEPPTGGSTLDDLRRGLWRRYRIAMPAPVTGADAIISAIGRSAAAVVVGPMSVFGPTHRLSRWQPRFDGWHAVYVEHATDGRWLWCDPLAPSGSQPDVVGVAELRPFAASAVVAPVALREDRGGEDMLAVVNITPFPSGPRRWTTRPGIDLAGWDPARPGQPVKRQVWSTRSSASADAIASIAWPGRDPQPVPHGGPFLRVTDGVYAGLFVPLADVDLEPAPDPCADQVALARQQGRADGIAAARAALADLR